MRERPSSWDDGALYFIDGFEHSTHHAIGWARAPKPELETLPATRSEVVVLSCLSMRRGLRPSSRGARMYSQYISVLYVVVFEPVMR